MKNSTYFCLIQIFTFSFMLVASTTLISQTNWTKHPGNPVLDVGLPGAWDAWNVNFSEVYFDGTTYKMWYTGQTASSNSGRIGLATSSDGILWTKHAKNPVMTASGPGFWDSSVVVFPVVLRDGATYKMWFTGGRLGFSEIGYATSSDGINWIKSAENPVLKVGAPGSQDDAWLATGAVVFDGTTYKMWYAGLGTTSPIQIGYATSSDGINWTKFAGNPVFGRGSPGSWDVSFVFSPDIVFDGTTYHMWYAGHDGVSFRIGYATSSDGISRTRHPNNPVLGLGESGEDWDDTGMGHPRVIFGGTTYHMWFFGDDGSNIRIGYATAPQNPTGISEDGDDSLPVTFSLVQNYPNPFNPTTTITYELTQSEFVNLSIYNASGQVVEILVNELKSAGIHSVQFSAQNLSSGLYFYRIETGGHSAVRKALLLK